MLSITRNRRFHNLGVTVIKYFYYNARIVTGIVMFSDSNGTQFGSQHISRSMGSANGFYNTQNMLPEYIYIYIAGQIFAASRA